MDSGQLTQMDAYKMPGIADLQMKVRVKFAKAWFAEYNGDNVAAEQFLNEAIEEEALQKSEEKK